ncbi:YIP1 family protein [Rhodobacter ferrooxidans]|uniref:Yip1 domain-containing protein n=1 Tax=Rhodobacter ferrooxidans TaxID=371731 RepID=C8RXW8_9RHOB|nr:YIP1 family protein [Rhodobacter sp. SW2]EEW26366.1 conserved hypothetical protein [Rhodobacter sp. SW2]
MDASIELLRDLVVQSFRAPRQAAARIIALNLPMAARWVGLGLMAVVSALLVHLSFSIQPAEVKDFFVEAMASPLRTAWMQAVFMLVAVALIHRIGAWRGGHGSFADALVLVAWLQFLLLLLQGLQLLAFAVLPLLADLVGLATLGLFFWLLSNFVAELHGFRSPLVVFVGILLSVFAAVLVLTLLLTFFFGG